MPGGEVGNYEWVLMWGHELVSVEDAEDCLSARPGGEVGDVCLGGDVFKEYGGA